MHNIPFPQRLRLSMKRRGLTQQQLASAIGVSRAAINKWFHGTIPHAGHIHRLAKFFNVPLDYFLEGFVFHPADGVNVDRFLISPEDIPANQLASAARAHAMGTEKQLGELLDLSMNTKEVWTRTDTGFEMRRVKLSKQEKKSQIDIDNVILEDNTGGMEIELSEVLDAVRKKASEPGQKAALARYCGATPQMVSAWLSGAKEPGGKYAVKLANWVGWLVRK